MLKLEGFEVWSPELLLRVRGLGACAGFKVEGFEVWSPGFFNIVFFRKVVVLYERYVNL